MHTDLLRSKDMRKLGFTNHRSEYWYLTRRIEGPTSFNLTINKHTGEYEIDILNEHSLWAEDYMNMREPYRNLIKAWIDLMLYKLNDAGLDIQYDHPKEIK